MPSLSKNTKREQISLIRRVLVKKPDASLRDIQEALNRVKRPMDLHYIGALVDDIRKERAKRIERQLVNTEIAKFEDIANLAMEELWKVTQTTSDDRAKVSALKVIVDSFDTLLSRKFDAGVFEKNLGSVKVNHNIAEYKISIIQAFENSRLFNNSSRQQGGDAPTSLEAG